MANEVERRNSELCQGDLSKNLEWIVIGARGERRIIKGAARVRGGREAMRGGDLLVRGGCQPVWGGAALALALLLARPAPEVGTC
jgi:hypothetical protein